MTRLFLEERYRRAYILFLKSLIQGFIYELPALVTGLFMFIWIAQKHQF